MLSMLIVLVQEFVSYEPVKREYVTLLAWYSFIVVHGKSFGSNMVGEKNCEYLDLFSVNYVPF